MHAPTKFIQLQANVHANTQAYSDALKCIHMQIGCNMFPFLSSLA